MAKMLYAATMSLAGFIAGYGGDDPDKGTEHEGAFGGAWSGPAATPCGWSGSA